MDLPGSIDHGASRLLLGECSFSGHLIQVVLNTGTDISVGLSVNLSICLSVYLSICLSVYMYICLSVYLSI